MGITRETAIEVARLCAKDKPQSYYAEPFYPHEWVIDAIQEGAKIAAMQMAKDLGRNVSDIHVRSADRQPAAAAKLDAPAPPEAK